MMVCRRSIWAAIAIGAFLLSGCSKTSETSPATPAGEIATLRSVVATSYPLHVLATAVAGDDFEVDGPLTLNDAGVSQFPTAVQIQRIQSADIVLLQGAGFEPWLEKVSVPRSRTIDTSTEYKDDLLTVPAQITHQHGPQGAAVGERTVATTWLDPALVRLQLAQIKQAVQQKLSVKPDDIQQRTADIEAKLRQLDDRLTELGQRLQKESATVFADSPDYVYLLRRLNVKGKIIAEADDAISQLKQSNAADQNALVLYFCRNASSNMAKQLEEHSATTVAVDCCKSATDEPLLQRMEANLDRLDAALR